MRLINRLKGGSLEDRLICLALAMLSITLLVAAAAGNRAPGVVPVLLEGFSILMLAVMLGAARWDFRRDAVKSTLLSGTSLACVTFFVLAMVSCAYSSNRAVSIQGAAQVCVGVLLYFVVSLNAKHVRHISQISAVLTVLALIGALIGCAEYGVDTTVQATGLFGDHQLYGSFLMILLPFVAISGLGEKDLNRQLLAQTATVAIIIALLLAHSHSAWLGAGIALILLGSLVTTVSPMNKREQPEKRKYLAPVLLISAGVLFLVLASPISESLINSPYSFASSARKDSGMDRQQVWREAMRMIAEHPVTGLGASMYSFSHHPYTGLAVPDRSAHVRPTLFDQTHNLYLQTAAEIGIPGSLALVAVVVTFWITGLRRLRSIERSDRRYMCLASLGATLAFAIDAFSSPSWQFGQIMILFWLALGVGVACLRQTSRREVRTSTNVVSLPTWFRPPAEAVGLLGLAALMPVTVIASTRLTNYYPSTVYGSMNGTVHHIEICVLPDPCSTAEVAADTSTYAHEAPFYQSDLPKTEPRLPPPVPDQYQTVKRGPHYRLQLELFIRDDSGIHDAGPVTLNPSTRWSTFKPDGIGSGTFRSEPYHSPYGKGGKAWSYANYADYKLYINAPADLGHRVVVVASYAGLTATTILDFTMATRGSYVSGGVGAASK